MAKRRGIYKQKGSQNWWIRYAGLDGKIVYESSGSTSLKDAEDLVIQRKNAIREGKQPEIRRIGKHTFRDLALQYLDWIKGRQKSARNRAYIVKWLMEGFGILPLRNFNTALVEQLQTDLMNKGLKNSSCNGTIGILKRMFAKAVEWEMVEEEALKRIRKVKPLRDDSKRMRYLSREECQALISACEAHLMPIVITALNTGMRKGEILSLKWDNVDLRHGFILLDRTKNGERREIPINDTLRATLARITRRIDIPYVFYNAATGRKYDDVKRSFKSALKKVEIQKCPDCNYQKPRLRSKDDAETCPNCKVKMGVLEGIDDFHFHDLRHTFASHLVMSGIDLTTVSRLLGHKSLTMTLRYSHLAPAHMAKAVSALDDVFGSKVSSVAERFIQQTI